MVRSCEASDVDNMGVNALNQEVMRSCKWSSDQIDDTYTCSDSEFLVASIDMELR